MSGYCSSCGNTICLCDSMPKLPMITMTLEEWGRVQDYIDSANKVIDFVAENSQLTKDNPNFRVPEEICDIIRELENYR